MLSFVTEEQKTEFLEYMKTTEFWVKQAESSLLLDIIVRVYRGGSYAVVRIANSHTNIVDNRYNNLPSVCLNCYYRKFQKDRNFDAIERDIIGSYKKNGVL